jgi:hypothetical protein
MRQRMRAAGSRNLYVVVDEVDRGATHQCDDPGKPVTAPELKHTTARL